MNKFIHLLFVNPPREKTKQQNLLFLITVVFVVLLFLLMVTPNLNAQNIGINATGLTPNTSAGLDIDFTNKGLLIPRVTTAQRNAIASPAHSLLIYNITTDCFEAWNNNTNTWVAFGCIGCQLPGVFSAIASSNLAATSFDANWSASAGVTTYFLDVATDAGFTAFVTGYNNLNVGNVLTLPVTGLTCATTYYYRIRAENNCGTSTNSNVITVVTSSSTSGTSTFTTSGTFIVPACVTNICIEVWGGGGGGGGRAQACGCNVCGEVAGGGGGGGGSYGQQCFTVVPGNSYAVNVGAGGAGAASVGCCATAPNGTVGGTSSVGALISAGGGTGGNGAASGTPGTGGIGGTSSATTNISGSNGGNATNGCASKGIGGTGAQGNIAPGGNGGDNIGASTSGLSGKVIITW